MTVTLGSGNDAEGIKGGRGKGGTSKAGKPHKWVNGFHFLLQSLTLLSFTAHRICVPRLLHKDSVNSVDSVAACGLATVAMHTGCHGFASLHAPVCRMVFCMLGFWSTVS